MTPRTRMLAALVGLLLGSLLATAYFLTPNPKGHATHTQLGLSECLVVRQFGVRCPSCGMTTSWSHLTKGNLAGAARSNAGGLVLGLLAVCLSPFLLASACLGKWCYLRPTLSVVFPLSAAVVLVVLFDWFYRVGWSLATDRLFAW